MTIEAKGDISNIEILADTKPLMLFIEFIKSVLQTRNRPFNLSDLGSELARIEMDSSTAGTNKFTVVFIHPIVFFVLLLQFVQVISRSKLSRRFVILTCPQ